MSKPPSGHIVWSVPSITITSSNQNSAVRAPGLNTPSETLPRTDAVWANVEGAVWSTPLIRHLPVHGFVCMSTRISTSVHAPVTTAGPVAPVVVSLQMNAQLFDVSTPTQPYAPNAALPRAQTLYFELVSSVTGLTQNDMAATDCPANAGAFQDSSADADGLACNPWPPPLTDGVRAYADPTVGVPVTPAESAPPEVEGVPVGQPSKLVRNRATFATYTLLIVLPVEYARERTVLCGGLCAAGEADQRVQVAPPRNVADVAFLPPLRVPLVAELIGASAARG
jgi:hypothetical protein